MNVTEEIAALREKFGARPRGEEVLAVLERCEDDDQRAEVERAFVRQTDNGPRPGDGDQSLAIAPPPELDVAADE